MKWIDRAETKYGHLAIPHLLSWIGYLTAFTFVLFKFNPRIFEVLELYPDRVLAGEVWRLVTYLFIPAVNSFIPLPDWVNAAFYVLFMMWVGNGLDQAWGPLRTNLYVLVTAVGITIAAFVFGHTETSYLFLQAAFLAYARFYPEQQITLYFLLPVKVKWVAWFDGALLVYQFTTREDSFRMALIATLVAYFLFFGREIFQAARHRQDVAARRQRFQAAARRPDDEAMHHCAVCGRTEIQAPHLEFRVAKDGNEYCLEHLPKAPLVPPPVA
ncbi:MAG: hypothetical protein WDN28_11385 [Chthoniobacter sp.]